jgi:zinc transporter
MTSHLIHAYKLDGKGKGKAITKNFTPATKGSEFTWIHLDATHAETEAFLTKEVKGLDTLVLKALVAGETRPRMEQVGDGVLLILRGVNLNPNTDPEDMVSIRFWVTKNQVISTRRRKLKAVVDMEEKIKAGQGPKDVGDLLCSLTARLFERMEPVLSTLDETTDDIEEQVLESAGVELREAIVKVRKQAIVFRRYMAPQRDAISQLRMANITWLNEGHKRRLQESHNHVTRYVEDLDAVRERAQIVKDELANILSDKLNKNMYILSVIAAIFLPLGFLTGMLGINIGGMPGADNPDAFWIFTGLLVALVTAQIWLFKRLGWF